MHYQKFESFAELGSEHHGCMRNYREILLKIAEGVIMTVHPEDDFLKTRAGEQAL